jgi:hypothetical protein
MAQLMAEEFDIDSDPAPFFKRRGFASRRLLSFLLDGVLRAVDGDVVVFYDEVDEFFEKPFAREFFGGLRYIIDERAGNSIIVKDFRFDVDDGPAIEGDPAELLEDWQRRLNLVFEDPDRTTRIVEKYPLPKRETRPIRPPISG